MENHTIGTANPLNPILIYVFELNLVIFFFLRTTKKREKNKVSAPTQDFFVEENE
jgi:hypothetical protein